MSYCKQAWSCLARELAGCGLSMIAQFFMSGKHVFQVSHDLENRKAVVRRRYRYPKLEANFQRIKFQNPIPPSGVSTQFSVTLFSSQSTHTTGRMYTDSTTITTSCVVSTLLLELSPSSPLAELLLQEVLPLKLTLLECAYMYIDSIAKLLLRVVLPLKPTSLEGALTPPPSLLANLLLKVVMHRHTIHHGL